MSKVFNVKGFWAYVGMLFLNAFVDLGHKIIIQNAIFKMFDGGEQVVLTAIVNALILIPFIFLFSPSGFIADKFPKHIVMRYSAMVAVVAVILITAAYIAGWFWCAFSLTLLLAIQSAIYSPAKYGYIKELVGDHNLAQANGIVQAVTIVAILGGTFVFSAGFEYFLYEKPELTLSTIMQCIAPLGGVLILLTIIELFLAYKLPAKKQLLENKHFSLNSYIKGKYLITNVKAITQHRVIWLSIVGLSMFWAISQVVLASYPAFAKEVLQENNTLVIQGILACAGIGIMIGSLIAGRFSRNYIELGLIPIGAIGIALALGLMPTLETRLTMSLTFLLLGILGGIFIIPLNALIQYHANEDDLGTVLAGNNWVQNIVMLSFLSLTVFFAYYGLETKSIFYGLMLVGFVAAIYTIYQLPHSLVRIIASVVFLQRYKINVVGFDNLPKTGGALLLGNHISWIDWAILQIASPRPIRFVMLRSIYNQWYLNPIFRFFGVIPISSGQSKDSLQLINEKLKAGEIVCLFPEGAISRTGSLGLFHKGYERALDEVEGVIIPFYLHGLWGSLFSRANSEKLRRNTLKGRRRNITVTFGEALPVDTKADQLKQKIFELSFIAWETHTDILDPLPLSWIRTAKEQLRSISVIESNGATMSNGRLLAATAAFAHDIQKFSPEQNVAILLPASTAAIIANMAVMLKGKTAVNINYTSSAAAVQAGIQQAHIKTVYTSTKFMNKLEQRGIDTNTMLQGVNIIYMENIKESLSKLRLAMAFVLAYTLPASLFYRYFGKSVSLDDPAAILFSSGSEGSPKGIVLSHRNFMANIKQISDVLKTQDTDVVMGCLPPFHSFGLTVTTFLPLVEGIPVVCHPDPTDVLNVAKSICRNNVTIMCATATFLRLYNKNRKVQPLMLDSLRIVVAGAEKLSAEVRSEFKDKFNKIIYEGYGATETTPVASVNIPDQLDADAWSVQIGQKTGTVGLPVPGCAFRIVDPQTLTALPIGEDGLILISGTQVMLGYLNDPEKTQSVIVELDGRRWYKTGDKGHLDQDGFLTIVDRYSRFAKIGGEMISLGAVEQAIAALFNDTEAECIAVSLPDDKKGEQVILLSTYNITIEDLRKQLLAAEMNALMIPAQVFVIDAIPKLGSGKTDFSAAKELAKSLMAK
jgi:acyl-[acyl-carrier-protein]-phospholipid O-acyltransferase/long-chain-fatty-acid--[acyl-carrier-protein] ligase